MKCIITCEHSSNRVPQRFAHLFAGREEVLASHRAYDRGAVEMARKLAPKLHAPVHCGTVTRLLVDLNRSLTNEKSLYSEYSRKLAPDERRLLLREYYRPFRRRVMDEIEEVTVLGRPVLHISVHSFAPVIDDRVRKADLGLLYDPVRSVEKKICAFLVQLFRQEEKALKVRRNYPYLGKTDGFITYLRKRYPAKLYGGIELELNQALLSAAGGKKREMEALLVPGLAEILHHEDFSKLIDDMSGAGGKL
jgi:predicted N-formylglutamate amidohydrolase